MKRAQLGKLAHPPDSLRKIKRCLSNGMTFLKSDTILVFVCGATPNPAFPGGRDRIMDYAKKHLKQFNFFIAEKFFEVFQNAEDIDLLSIEDQLSKYSDCIIIVLESESAFTELGAFAIKEDIAKMVLVVNSIDYEKSKSFISLGPISKINKISRFKPSIHTDLRSILTIAPELSKRLSTIERKYNKKTVLSDFEAFSSSSPKIKMYFLHDIITLFHPLTHSEIISILTNFYGDNEFKIHTELNLLIVLGFIQKIDDYFVKNTDERYLFFRFFGMDETSLRSEIINHYHKYAKHRTSILHKKINIVL